MTWEFLPIGPLSLLTCMFLAFNNQHASILAYSQPVLQCHECLYLQLSQDSIFWIKVLVQLTLSLLQPCS